MNKEPGIYSARYAGEDTSYDIKNQMLLDRLQGVPREKRTARFVCAIAAVVPGHEPIVVRGTIEGYIGDKPAGENGFAYDPIFYVPDLNCSTAELSPEEKNARSHRGNALRAMREELKQYISYMLHSTTFAQSIQECPRHSCCSPSAKVVEWSIYESFDCE